MISYYTLTDTKKIKEITYDLYAVFLSKDAAQNEATDLKKTYKKLYSVDVSTYVIPVKGEGKKGMRGYGIYIEHIE